ncbi:MAG: hypothetical protein MJZ05_09640 [Fibrobacter sp.]|nr:hypothetical protein [Fibrobacter sp.]
MDIFKNLAMLSIAAVMFVACGGDNGSSAKDEDSSSSVADEEKSSSSTKNSSSSTKNSSSSDKESSSSAKESSSSSVAKYVCDIYTLADALSCKCDENREGKLSYNYDSNVELVCIHDAELNKWGWIVKKDESSSSSEAKSSSSSVKESSSSVKVSSSSGAKSSSSVVKSSSSSAKSSSSSRVILSSGEESSSSAKSSSSSAKSSSSSVKVSSSSEYVPFDHSVTLAGVAQVGKNAYKQFTDERNGRSYYYITITGKDTSNKENTVTVMAENLNIGEMVRGIKEQIDDTKIERYCYRNDTTNCDKYGGLYQWAEMMQLPSRCNTESCADLIQENHQGICPEGWRLLTYNDFHTVYHSNTNVASPLVKGLRSSYFGAGSNYSGYSLLGGGMRSDDGSFKDLGLAEYWFHPLESNENIAFSNTVSTSNTSAAGYSRSYKLSARSVRCVKMVTE